MGDLKALILAFEAGMLLEREACKGACRVVGARYPTDIWPEDGQSLDCKSARMARLTAENCEREIDLRSTERGMIETVQPHQQSVVAEKSELDKKATDLSNFIGTSPIFETLDPEEQERLREQNDVMWQYSEILGARIAAFCAGPTRATG